MHKTTKRLWVRVAATLGLGGLGAGVAWAIAASRRNRGPVRRSVTIARAPAEVYGFWRDLTNVPAFMTNIDSVEVFDGERSRWRAHGPVGPAVTWQAVVVDDAPNERLAWKSTEPSEIEMSGAVRFERAPGDRGTEVHLELHFGPADGAPDGVGKFLWRPLAGPMLERDLQRLKQLMETGHVVHSDASLHEGPHPARPSSLPAASNGSAT
ncbi:MAG TPA: SRPBCC family protein [Polyangia bacterium]|nr:SRPBCC family protein [Polyangia bacterium]